MPARYKPASINLFHVWHYKCMMLQLWTGASGRDGNYSTSTCLQQWLQKGYFQVFVAIQVSLDSMVEMACLDLLEAREKRV